MNDTINNRLSNFEILRLVLMFLIVLHHGIVWGVGLSYYSRFGGELLINEDNIPLFAILNSFCIVGVNCFVLISGYFSIKPSYEKIRALLFQVLFYTVLLITFHNLINGHILGAIYSFLIFSHSPWWFFVDYVILMIIAPVLNLAFKHLDRRMNRSIMLLLLGVSIYLGFFYTNEVNKDGYTVFQFITLYYVGRYISTYNITFRKSICIVMYVLPSILSGVLMSYFITVGNAANAWQCTYYNSPLVIMSSIAFFLLFKNINVTNTKVNKVAKSSFSIYLFQNTPLVAGLYYGAIKDLVKSDVLNPPYIVLCLLGLVFVIMITSISLDQVRIWMYNNLVCKKHSKTLSKWIKTS